MSHVVACAWFWVGTGETIEGSPPDGWIVSRELQINTTTLADRCGTAHCYATRIHRCYLLLPLSVFLCLLCLYISGMHANVTYKRWVHDKSYITNISHT